MRRLLPIPLLGLLLCTTAVSADEGDHRRARALVEAGEILPLEQLLTRAAAGRPWRLLEADLEEEDGRLVYEFELLDEQGRVRELRFDARSGVPLDAEGEP